MARDKRSRRPASTEENREGQLVSLAIDLAEKQIVDGTASSQVMTHFLKLGSTREKLEQERLRRENELLKAKIDQLASAQRMEELYADALRAMSTYSGREVQEIEMGDEYNDEDLYGAE
jgi:hypothetical protein